MSDGWISLDRAIRDHWLYQEKRTFSRYEAWIDILMDANHEENKFMMSGELIQVNRGSFITSIRKLGERWNWSRTKVKLFLSALEADQMLTIKSDTKKTLIIVDNYGFYQGFKLERRHQKAAEVTPKSHRNATEMPQKDTNNKVLSSSPTTKYNNININARARVYDLYQRAFPKKPLNEFIAQSIAEWINDFHGQEEIVCLAIKNAAEYSAENFKYVENTLKRWKAQGVKTEADAKKIIADFDQRKQEKIKREAARQGEEQIQPAELPHVPLYNWVTGKLDGDVESSE